MLHCGPHHGRARDQHASARPADGVAGLRAAGDAGGREGRQDLDAPVRRGQGGDGRVRALDGGSGPTRIRVRAAAGGGGEGRAGHAPVLQARAARSVKRRSCIPSANAWVAAHAAALDASEAEGRSGAGPCEERLVRQPRHDACARVRCAERRGAGEPGGGRRRGQVPDAAGGGQRQPHCPMVVWIVSASVADTTAGDPSSQPAEAVAGQAAGPGARVGRRDPRRAGQPRVPAGGAGGRGAVHAGVPVRGRCAGRRGAADDAARSGASGHADAASIWRTGPPGRVPRVRSQRAGAGLLQDAA
mmetsp:Transcript_28054/g.90586  ORF Transcript_28054/g.90586 Transcript_28054/m.90586 type:complete len:302 (-) Transcript_28054:571-1476(-)